MSTVLAERLAAADKTRAAAEFERQSFRVRAIKMLCGVLLGICFWFSVPYSFPLQMDQDPKKAAANEAAAYEGNISRQVAMPVVVLISVYLLWRLPKRGKLGSRLLPIACVYVGWALVSVSWSDNPTITAKRLVVFAINCLFAYTLSRVFSVLELALFGFAQTTIVALLALFVTLVYLHDFAPLDSDYRFTGVMTANYQAMNLVAGMICAMTLLQKRPQWVRWIAPWMGLGLVLLYLTRSRLGSILGLLMLSFMVVRYAKQNLAPHARALAIIAVLTAAVPGLIYTVGLSGGGAAQSAFMMGRNDTQNTSNLSNRAPLWTELMVSVGDRPIIGYGYEAFWTPARVARISADQGWTVPHAHDTYLDQTLSLGIVGMILYAILLWGGAGMAWRRYKRWRSESALYAAILLTWVSLTGIAESVPLDPYLPTMLAYACIVKMCMVEGSEAETISEFDSSEIITGLARSVEIPKPKQIAARNPRRTPRRFATGPLG